MLADGLAVKLRSRSSLEACDLGVRLCQHAARSVFFCHLGLLVPLTALSLPLCAVAPWLPGLALWWLKPWLDRPVLFALSRAAFGQRTGLVDLWRERRQVLWSQLLLTLTQRRACPWRSFTQPVLQLEGLRGRERARRVHRLRGPHTVVASALTFLFCLTELILLGALFSLILWLTPRGYTPAPGDIFSARAPGWQGAAFALLYAAVLGLLEPFYVAAGFGMYLNRRVELEAWDIEQELRRAFA
jgi:hypothetical protein